MKIILIGPPLSGKGAQSELLIKKFNLKLVSVGEIFRKHISNNSPVGIKAKSYITCGKLVPNKITNKIVFEELNDLGNTNFLLDGYPRDYDQAKELINYFSKNNIHDEIFIEINVSKDIALSRIKHRLICPVCNKMRTTDTDTCDYCGNNLVKRIDDEPAIFEKRFIDYESKISKIRETIQEKYYIVESTTIENTFNDICEIIKKEQNDNC